MTDNHEDMIAAVRTDLRDWENTGDGSPDAYKERHVAALRAVLARLEASRWRPIAEPIVGHQDVWLAYSDGDIGGPVHYGTAPSPESFHEDVTHWMPAWVPAPPATATEGGEG